MAPRESKLTIECLSMNFTMDQLIHIKVDGPPLLEWEPKVTIKLWLQDKCRQFNRRDDSEKSLPEPSDMDPENELVFSLDGWDEWLQEVDATKFVSL